MRRREFIGLAGGAAIAWATHGRAQHDVRVRRIGFLSGVADTDPEIQSWVKEFVQGLEKLGWVNGRNVRIDTRFGDADAGAARLSTLAAELIELGPDVILAVGAPAAAAVRQQTLSLPIVFAAVADPVAAGFVTNLSRPEGNITGFTNFRTHCRIRSRSEWRCCRTSKPRYSSTSPVHYWRGSNATSARNVSISLLHCRWRFYVLWGTTARPIQGRGVIRRPNIKE